MDAPAPTHPRRLTLSGSALKVIATLTMFVDHTAVTLSQTTAQITLFTVANYRITLYYLMRAIGRISLPLFAFLLVEGYLHTHDRRMYGIRLALFAAISEVPWNLAHCGRMLMPQSQSVFVTLTLSYVALCLVGRMERETDRARLVRDGAGVLAIFFVTHIAHCDYGTKALGCILAIYLLRSQAVPRAIVASSCLPNSLYALVAFWPIALYNGQRGFIRGKALQLLFYAIYPAHMLLRWWGMTRWGWH